MSKCHPGQVILISREIKYFPSLPACKYAAKLFTTSDFVGYSLVHVYTQYVYYTYLSVSNHLTVKQVSDLDFMLNSFTKDCKNVNLTNNNKKRVHQSQTLNKLAISVDALSISKI